MRRAHQIRIGSMFILLLVAGACAPPGTRETGSEEKTIGRATTEYGEFSIQVEPVCTVQSGPIIVRLTYGYSGTADRLRIGLSPLGRSAEVEPPPGWEPIPRRAALVGPSVLTWAPKPKDSRTEFYALHRDFGGIKDGLHEVKFRWRVRSADSGREELAVVEHSVGLDVRPAMDESVGKLQEFIDHELARPDVAESFKPIARALDGAFEPRVLRLRFDLLDDPRLPEDCANINPAVRYRGHEPISAVEERSLLNAICDYLARPYPRYASHLVYWMTGKAAPRGFVDTIGPKFDHLHLLVRAAAAASFPELLDGPREKKLLSELAARYGPPDPAIVVANVRQLDSAGYRDREAAAAALRKLGAPALGLLRAEVAKPRSAESIERLRALIAAIEKADRAEDQPLEARVLKHLQVAKTKRADAMLDAIAAAKSDAWIVREARAIRGQAK